jgi:hypothetical protein
LDQEGEGNRQNDEFAELEQEAEEPSDRERRPPPKSGRR